MIGGISQPPLQPFDGLLFIALQQNRPPVLPFNRAYWAISGRLLAGCYPGNLDPEEARSKLQGLIGCGVSRIISLMEANEVGLGGKPFLDYRPQLEELRPKR